MQVKVAIARFPYGNQEVPAVGNWLIETVIKIKSDPRISGLVHREINDTPITMGRNLSVQWAKQEKADLLLMIDSDVFPDVGTTRADHAYAGAKPFWDVALQFLLDHHGPAVIGAPYCGPPPHENVYVFKPATYQSDNPNVDLRVEQFTREEAAQRGGIEEVFALPTGLILFDMRAFDSMGHPYFKYEYEDETECAKATTEDVYTTRNMALCGAPQYCAWPCWAGHFKQKLVGRPSLLTMDAVREQYRAAILRGQLTNERLTMIGEGK